MYYGWSLKIDPECENVCEPFDCPQEGIRPSNRVYKMICPMDVSQPLPSYLSTSLVGPCGNRNGG